MPRTSSEGKFLIVISGPSGSGKTTLWRMLLKDFRDIVRSISVTTRPPRGKEKNRKDYHFVSEDEFREMVKKGEFLEWACVHGHYYGTPKRNIDEARKNGFDLILEIDVQGAMKVKRSGLDAVFIFIAPPSLSELRRRLKKRGDISGKELERRIKVAAREMKYIPRYDYVIVNRRLKQAYDELRSVIIAERLKRRNWMFSR